MFGRLQRRLRADVDGWSATTALLCALILVPLGAVVLGVGDAGPEWGHLAETVLAGYVANTAVLIVLVAALALVAAIPTAWLVAVFDFPGRRFFEWALILPLAIPTYVAAFVYSTVYEAGIPLLVWIRGNLGAAAFDFAETGLRYGILVLLLAAVLYPYLFISARVSFSRQQGSLIEAAHVLGRPPRSVFFSVALPLARPAIVAGLSLIAMEVVNDYGAVHFMGVPTLTVGIFRTWTGLSDPASAVRLAGFVMVAVLAVLLVEGLHRGRARFAEEATSAKPLSRRRLVGWRALGATAACAAPLAAGFGFPVAALLRWSWNLEELHLGRSWEHLAASLLLALATAATLAAMALLFAYARKLHFARWLRALVRCASMGYAVPGAVVALGVMITLGRLDAALVALEERFGIAAPLFSGSIAAIVSGYVVRFIAVAYHPLQAGMARICGSLDEASRTLGHSPSGTLWRINLPLLRGTLLGATMLVFVDILKELPLTLILRPANFETLATIAFGMASEGNIYDSAVPSLMIVALGALGLIVLNRYMARVSR